MSDDGREPAHHKDLATRDDSSDAASEDTPSQGPNLTLLYSLIGLALVLAIGFAMMIVFPFYRRR
jgi:hypothetical protein